MLSLLFKPSVLGRALDEKIKQCYKNAIAYINSHNPHDEKKKKGKFFNVDYVCNGQEVFDYLSNHSVDVLLLDVNMPIKNGFEVLEEINQKNIKIKVIVLTAYTDIASIIEAAKLGARDFVLKPYDFDKLLITIRNVIMSEMY